MPAGFCVHGDDCMAPNPSTVLVSSSLVDPIALGQVLCTEYLPLVAGTNHSWVFQLNKVDFARVAYASGTPVVEPLVVQCKFSDEGNTVWCTYRK